MSDEHIEHAIKELNNLLYATSYNFRDQPPNRGQSTVPTTTLNIQDYIRALQIGGYGFSVNFPRGIFGASNNWPLSIFNPGGAGVIIYSINGSTGGGQISFQAHSVTADPAYNTVVPIYNRKIGGEGIGILSVTYNTTGLAIPTTSPTIDELGTVSTNNGSELLTNGDIFTLPSGDKAGLVIWAITVAGTTNGSMSVSGVIVPA